MFWNMTDRLQWDTTVIWIATCPIDAAGHESLAVTQNRNVFILIVHWYGEFFDTEDVYLYHTPQCYAVVQSVVSESAVISSFPIPDSSSRSNMCYQSMRWLKGRPSTPLVTNYLSQKSPGGANPYDPE